MPKGDWRGQRELHFPWIFLFSFTSTEEHWMQRGKIPLGGKGNGELRDVSVKVSKTPSKLIEGAIYGEKKKRAPSL